MKLSKIIGTLVLVITIIVCSSDFFIAYATDINYDAHKPQYLSSGIADKIMGVLGFVGICAVIVGLAFVGFNMVLGSAQEKAVAMEKFGGIIFAGIFLMAFSAIANFIIPIVWGL